MLSFYDVDADYADYLRRFDCKVPHIKYEAREKFTCGVVLSINGCDYFAPVSSKAYKQRTSMIIVDKDGSILSAIKLNYMFPAPQTVVTRMSISDIRRDDSSYANLLQKEYEFCRANEGEILKVAKRVYSIGCNPRHFLNGLCCNFKLLEEKSRAYFLTIMDEAFSEYECKHCDETSDGSGSSVK